MFLLDKKWLQLLALIIVAVATVLIIYISFLILWPKESMTVVQPYKVVTPVVKQGDLLEYEVTYCTDKNIQFIVERELLNLDNGELWDVPDRINTLNKGCITEVHKVMTPSRAEPGHYKMLARVSLQVNALKYIRKTYETEPFEILQP